MATAKEYLAKAASYIGTSGTDNIFNTWIWGYHCYNPDVYPWCAAFQSYVGVHDLNMPFHPSASAAGVANQGKRVADEDVQPGDWVLFNWDGRQSWGWADHIGVVEWFDHSSGYFGTIEGNTGNVYGGEVARVTRYNYGSYATAFFRPPYESKKEEPTLERKVQQWKFNSEDAQKWKPIRNSDGTFTFKNKACGLVLDVRGGGTKDGTTVQAYPANGTVSQKFRLVQLDTGYSPKSVAPFELVPMVNERSRVDVSGGSRDDGAKIQIYRANGTNAQRFAIVDQGDGWWVFVNVKSGKTIDVLNGGK